MVDPAWFAAGVVTVSLVLQHWRMDRIRRDLEKEIQHLTRRVDDVSVHGREALAAYKLEAARTYHSKADLTVMTREIIGAIRSVERQGDDDAT